MDLIGKTSGEITPAKDSKFSRSKNNEVSRESENCNPNMSSPVLKSSNSPSVKSASKSQKSVTKKCNPSTNPVASFPIKNKIRERKFVVAKKNSKRDKENTSTTVVCKCNNKADGKSFKCLCVAYENLRASQEEFFKNRSIHERATESKKCDGAEIGIEGEAENENPLTRNPDVVNGYEDKVEFDDCSEASRYDEKNDGDQIEGADEIGISNSNVKRRRDKLMEVARENVPEPGSGRVMHLVKAFENLLSIPKSKDPDEKDKKEVEDDKKGMKWALPGLQSIADPERAETQVSSSSFCPSDFILTSESLGLDSRLSASLDSSQGSFSISSRTSGGGRRSRRNSAESSGTFARRYWKRKQLNATSLKPFKLRTEQRGRSKEEEFVKKVQHMMEEEEKQRIPIAQGLPWTTDQPEFLVKPPVKESTRPVDLVLHSDVRAVERAEFDNQVAEKMNLIEQYRMERERLQKLAEEEEIRRLRKELIPKAQPMPYFDRPFMPRRSNKHPTIPRDPKFHVPQHKKIKSCMSWNDFCIEQQ